MQKPALHARVLARYAWRLVRPVLVIYLLVVVMLSAFERWLVYPAPPHAGADWIAAELPHEDVHFTAHDGVRLHGWYVPHAAPRAVVLFCHGNGEHVARLAPMLALLRERAGVSVFAWDYRGYGHSGGKPSEKNLLADARAAQLWLANHEGIRPEDVVLYGRSLGGAVAVGLASEHSVRGMVLERTFADMVETAAYHFPWLPVKWVMRNRYPSAQRIASCRSKWASGCSTPPRRRTSGSSSSKAATTTARSPTSSTKRWASFSIRFQRCRSRPTVRRRRRNDGSGYTLTIVSGISRRNIYTITACPRMPANSTFAAPRQPTTAHR
jgi:pimeloyl-ACP methyl ester carboxylesterase